MPFGGEKLIKWYYLIVFDGSPKFNKLYVLYFIIFVEIYFHIFKYLFFDSYCLPLRYTRDITNKDKE